MSHVVGLAFTFGLCLGAVVTAPVMLAIGRFWRSDRAVHHEPADISTALKRGIR